MDKSTISVGQQLHQAVQTSVPHFSNVGSTAADGLDGGSHKVFIHAFNVCLRGNTRTKQHVKGYGCCTHPQLLHSPLYLKLSENGGNVCLIGQIGENLQLQNTKHSSIIGW